MVQPLFHAENLSTDVSKIKNGVQRNIFFIFDVLSETAITFVGIWLFLQIKNTVYLRKTRLVCKRGYLRMRNYVEIFYVTNVYRTL